ncbi:hypothetical protein Q5P01_016985 [Channa striata]|uniref:Uncharacterized protein n=1 Tax=Channa striata TaxID=64152 RepID=A0AA88MCI8_CHASR|nr:hypothetical protein Q5P01_016985 [Channa striata]
MGGAGGERQKAYDFVQGKDRALRWRDFLMDVAKGLLPEDKLTLSCELSAAHICEHILDQSAMNTGKHPDCRPGLRSLEICWKS